MIFVRVLFLILFAAFAVAVNSKAGSPEIWFNPLTWNLRESPLGIEYSKHDFPALLKPDAPWQMSAAHVAVLSLQGNVVWSYPDLPALVAFLRVHRFRVAFSDGMLFTGGVCGKGIEGMSQDLDVNRESVLIARKWKEAGGPLDYVIMDGPLYYGHHYARDCHYSIDDVARRAAATLSGMRAYFTSLRVVDAEGPGEFPNEQWLAEMAAWFPAFRQAAGVPIEAVALDLHWQDIRSGQSFHDTARRAVGSFRPTGVRTGLIINAESRSGMTDAEWMEENRAHLRAVAGADLGLDFIDINSWQGHPTHNLPETDPTAYTSLIDYAVKTWK